MSINIACFQIVEYYFGFLILLNYISEMPEYGADEIDVYYGKSRFDETQFS